MKRADILFWSVAAAVVALFFFTAQVGGTEWGGTDPAELYYNLLVRGFRAGHLSLERAVPPGLAALSDPYNPAANAPYRYAPYFLQDTSLYHGKLYLYFGVAPALVLFWPWVAFTGSFLAHKHAVAIFCAAGFLVAAALLRAFWRRYFPEVSGAVAAAGLLALGLASSLTMLLERPGICEVPISCAFLFLAVSLAALWRAWHDPARRVAWLALASAAYGLVIASRPSDLFGAVILLAPLWLERPRGARLGRLLIAAAAPITAAGLGIMAYNGLRFGSPFDFGHAYQLSDIGLAPGFKPGALGYNLFFYFLAPTHWSKLFPFAQGIDLPKLPPGYYPPDGVFGMLPNLPVVGLALAAPWALRDRDPGERAGLRMLLIPLAALTLLILGPLLLYFAACGRYEAEYLPWLVLLAVAGIFGLERRRARTGRGKALRSLWVTLLAFSCAFDLLATCGRYSGDRYADGQVLAQAGKLPQASAKFRAAIAVNPGFSQARLALGNLLLQEGQPAAALVQFRRVAENQPTSALAHYLLGGALEAAGDFEGALAEERAAQRLDPRQPLIDDNLGFVLSRLRRYPEAEEAFRSALRLKPDDAGAQGSLGDLYLVTGRALDAVGAYEQALRYDPNNAEMHARLSAALRALENSP